MSSDPLSRESMYQLENRLGVRRFDFDCKTVYPVHGFVFRHRESISALFSK